MKAEVKVLFLININEQVSIRGIQSLFINKFNKVVGKAKLINISVLHSYELTFYNKQISQIVNYDKLAKLFYGLMNNSHG